MKLIDVKMPGPLKLSITLKKLSKCNKQVDSSNSNVREIFGCTLWCSKYLPLQTKVHSFSWLQFENKQLVVELEWWNWSGGTTVAVHYGCSWRMLMLNMRAGYDKCSSDVGLLSNFWNLDSNDNGVVVSPFPWEPGKNVVTEIENLTFSDFEDDIFACHKEAFDEQGLQLQLENDCMDIPFFLYCVSDSFCLFPCNNCLYVVWSCSPMKLKLRAEVT